MTARAAAGSVLLTGETDDGQEAKGGSANARQRFRNSLTIVALGLWCLIRRGLLLGCLILWCLCAAPDAAPYDLCACPGAARGDPCAAPGAAPSRVSEPQHLMLLALRLAFPCQTLPFPKSKTLFDASSFALQPFHACSISLVRELF
jgi:hypothetical protein